MPTRTRKLKDSGQSLWLDNIQRKELHDGTLERMIAEDGICGLTSNPSIFMNAVTTTDDYDEQIAALLQDGRGPEEIYHHITVTDIRDACTLLKPVFDETQGRDGFVSIELNPQYAYDTDASIQDARNILAEIERPNCMIKVPGTREGIPVIRKLTAEGCNVNVTLLFSPERYREAARAYMEGLEERSRNGLPLGGIHSVTSFFISRIDTAVDKRLDALAGEARSMQQETAELRGQAALNVACTTYGMWQEMIASGRFQALAEKGGARVQRMLWASTGTKDPAYSDVKYVENLIAPDTINTLPPKTIAAFRDHGDPSCSISADCEAAAKVLERIEHAGIDLAEVFTVLEHEGVKAFETAYRNLLKAIEQKSVLLGARHAG